jgi:hypothetical protein
VSKCRSLRTIPKVCQWGCRLIAVRPEARNISAGRFRRENRRLIRTLTSDSQGSCSSTVSQGVISVCNRSEVRVKAVITGVDTKNRQTACNRPEMSLEATGGPSGGFGPPAGRRPQGLPMGRAGADASNGSPIGGAAR